MLVKRKAIQLSRQTLVVSLPSAWVKSNNIAKGDELDVQARDQELVVRNSTPRASRGKCANISLTTLDERTIRWVLSGLHKQGVDEIELSYTDQSSLPIITDVTKNLFIGMAMVKQGPKSCTIKSLAHEDPSTFDQTFRRAFQSTLTMADALFEAFKDHDLTSIPGIREMEKTNNQLTSFCQRLLNSSVIASSDKTHFLYTILWNLEKVCDDYKYICDTLISHPHRSSADMRGLLHSSNEYLRSYYELFYGFSINKLNDLAIQRTSLLSEAIRLVQATSFPENEIAIHLHNLVMKIQDFSTSMFAYHHVP